MTSQLLRDPPRWQGVKVAEKPANGARMNNQTIDLINRYYAAFNAGDIDAMLVCLSDSVIHDVNQGERRTGKERFHAFLARMAHHYDEQLSDIVVLATPDGARAAAEFNVSGKYLKTEPGLPDATGQSYQLPAATFFSIDDGKISRITTYYNLTDWIIQVSGHPLP